MEVHCCSLAYGVLCHVAFHLKLRSKEKLHSCIIIIIIIFNFLWKQAFIVPFESQSANSASWCCTHGTAAPAVGLHGETSLQLPLHSQTKPLPPTPRGASGAEASARPPGIALAMPAKLFFDQDVFARRVSLSLTCGERASASAWCTVCSIPWREARGAGTCRGLEDRFRLLTFL